MNTGAKKPIKQDPHCLPQAKWEIIEVELDKMLKQDIIESITSSWSSPVVLAEKKNGFPCFLRQNLNTRQCHCKRCLTTSKCARAN